MAGAEGEHVAEAALVDDGHGGVEREGAAQFVDIAVQGVAVARVVALPHCHHEVGGINGFADVGGKLFQNACLEMRQFHFVASMASVWAVTLNV